MTDVPIDLLSIGVSLNKPTVQDVRRSGFVPEGYSLEHTEKGIAYLKRIDTTDEDDEAINEHAVGKTSLWIPLDEIEIRYGLGTRLYFNFIKFIVASNVFLSVLSCIHWIVYLQRHNQLDTNNHFSDLFVGIYPFEMRTLWVTCNSLAIVSWFSFGSIWYLYVSKVLKSKGIGLDHDNPYLFSDAAVDFIKANEHVTSKQRFRRRVLSTFLFILVVLFVGGLIFGIQYDASLSKLRSPKLSFGVSFGITLIVSVANVLCTQLAQILARLELHRTWFALRRSEGIKLLTFKMVNVMTFYVGAFFSFPNRDNHCYLEDLGLKFFTLILSDLIISHSQELLLPLVISRGRYWLNIARNKGREDPPLPEFDIAQEYLEIFYRQFVIYIGMVVFPPMPLIGVISNLIEYPLDKYKMLRLCQPPKRLDNSMKEFLTFWLLIISVIAILCFPQGAIWTMALHRNQFEHYNNNTLQGYGYGCCDVLNGHSDINQTCIFYSQNSLINI